MKLTQRVVDSIKWEGSRRVVGDDSTTGLAIRVTEGATAYIVNFRAGGKQRRVVVGSTQDLQLVHARERAREILVAARRGVDLTIDPEALSRQRMPTFEQLWRRMIDEVDAKKLSPQTIADYEERARRLILPTLGKKLVGDITTADVEKTVVAATGQRNRVYVLTLIKKTINFAKSDRVLGDDYRNPAGAVTVKKPPKRGRAIEPEDLEKFGEALAAMEGERAVSPWLANLLRLSLLCGLRPGEVRSLTWDALNLPKRSMTVTGKTGERKVYLTDAARSVIEATPRVEGCKYVFAGRRFGEPIVAVYKVMKAVQTRAKIDPFRPYDLRHTAATGALAGGADVRAVQALLGHADLTTTAGYLHANDARRKEAAERAANFGRSVLRNAK
jgi:integrase